jgi:hypothetical protein
MCPLGVTMVESRMGAVPRERSVPTAAFVTRLRSSRSPDQTARQLPEQSTSPWVEPPSTGETRHRGALRNLRVMGLTRTLYRWRLGRLFRTLTSLGRRRGFPKNISGNRG